MTEEEIAEQKRLNQAYLTATAPRPEGKPEEGSGAAMQLEESSSGGATIPTSRNWALTSTTRMSTQTGNRLFPLALGVSMVVEIPRAEGMQHIATETIVEDLPVVQLVSESVPVVAVTEERPVEVLVVERVAINCTFDDNGCSKQLSLDVEDKRPLLEKKYIVFRKPVG